MMRSSRVSMALLTLFPFAALVSKYGILQETKNITLHHTAVTHARKKIECYGPILRTHTKTVTATRDAKCSVV